jgi:predicted nuclease of predicted toxin-antitoxin system
MAWQRVPETPQHEIDEFVDHFRSKARFLVDESLGIEVARVLRHLKWNVEFVGEVGLAGHSDEDVFARAWDEDRILLTHDADFLDDRRFPPHRNPGIVVLPGASGNEEALLRALSGLLAFVGPFRDGYWRTKVLASADGTWTFIRRNHQTGKMERTRLRSRPNGPIEIWIDS